MRELEVEQRLQSERERISRDLHDHVGAEVAAILTEAEVARLEASAEGREAGAFREVEQRARRTMGSLREAIWALGHGALTPEALADRLGQFARTQARHSALTIEAWATGDTDRALPPTQALALYRIGQEATRNAIRHSGGTRLVVIVEASRERVAVVVRDDGAFGGP
ncbi:MAG: histidine kinase, partial [Bacteroidota bacterium]